jgi:hypothetical protein
VSFLALRRESSPAALTPWRGFRFGLLGVLCWAALVAAKLALGFALRCAACAYLAHTQRRGAQRTGQRPASARRTATAGAELEAPVTARKDD